MKKFYIFWRRYGVYFLNALLFIAIGLDAYENKYGCLLGSIGAGLYLTIPCSHDVINNTKILWIIRQSYFAFICIALLHSFITH